MIEFNDDPEMDAAALQGEVRRVVEQINADGLFTSIRDCPLIAGENAIAHGRIGTTPQSFLAMAGAAGMDLRKSRPSDSLCVYVTSAVAGTADITVFF